MAALVQLNVVVVAAAVSSTRTFAAHSVLPGTGAPGASDQLVGAAPNRPVDHVCVPVPVGPAGMVAAHWYTAGSADCAPFAPLLPFCDHAETVAPVYVIPAVLVVPPVAVTGCVATYRRKPGVPGLAGGATAQPSVPL